jgi:hypothetical protein
VSPTKRGQTNADQHDRFARKTPPKPFAVPVPIDDEATDKYEGDVLREMRERRPTPLRVGHLEERVDQVVKTQGEWRAEVSKEIGDVKTAVAGELGKVNGALGSLAGEVKGLATVVQNALQRDHVTFTAKVEVDKAEKLGAVEVNTEKNLDKVEAKKDGRKFWLQIGGALLGGGAAVTVLNKLLHWLGVF